MMRPPGNLGLWRSATLTAMVGALLVVSLGASLLVDPGPAGPRMAVAREDGATPAATPVAAIVVTHDPLDGNPPYPEAREDDPLDGDPRDSDLPSEDTGAPPGQKRLEIVRSGRPTEAPPTQPAYDGDPETVWTPDVDGGEAWLWIDLGEERRLREIRWLARGSGGIEIAVSSDRASWSDVERVETRTLKMWHGIPLRADARYVRLTLIPDDDGDLPELAEVAVYGPDRERVVAAEQDSDVDRPRERNRDRQETAASRQSAERVDESPVERRQKHNGGSGRVHISTKPGETRCKGKRARCRAQEGRVNVEEDCAETGSCTIDVKADGGTAICDTSGGQESRAGGGEGKRSGNGGRCEAVADGGTVTIGDIDP